MILQDPWKNRQKDQRRAAESHRQWYMMVTTRTYNHYLVNIMVNIWLMMVNKYLVGGWYTYPSEKYDGVMAGWWYTCPSEK